MWVATFGLGAKIGWGARMGWGTISLPHPCSSPWLFDNFLHNMHNFSWTPFIFSLAMNAKCKTLSIMQSLLYFFSPYIAVAAVIRSATSLWPRISPSVRWWVGRSMGHNFLKGWEAALPCPYGALFFHKTKTINACDFFSETRQLRFHVRIFKRSWRDAHRH